MAFMIAIVFRWVNGLMRDDVFKLTFKKTNRNILLNRQNAYFDSETGNMNREAFSWIS
jgi:hypothetical protein